MGLGMILGSTDIKQVNAWGKNLTKLMQDRLLGHNPQHGIFLDSCSHHCGSWGHLYVGSKNQAAAFQDWYANGSQSLPNKGYYAQAEAYPCRTCGCGSRPPDLVV